MGLSYLESSIGRGPMLIKLLLFCYFYPEQTLRPQPRLDAQTNKQTNKLKTHILKLQKYFISGLNKIINEYIFLPRTTKVPAYTLNLK